MAVTGSKHPETVLPVALYKLVKTRNAVGFTEAELFLPMGCELGSYKDRDLPKDFAMWQTMSKVQLIMFDIAKILSFDALRASLRVFPLTVRSNKWDVIFICTVNER